MFRRLRRKQRQAAEGSEHSSFLAHASTRKRSSPRQPGTPCAFVPHLLPGSSVAVPAEPLRCGERRLSGRGRLRWSKMLDLYPIIVAAVMTVLVLIASLCTRAHAFSTSPHLLAARPNFFFPLLFTPTADVLVYFQSEEDRNTAWAPKIAVVIGPTLTCLLVLMLPMDVANRSSAGGLPMDVLGRCSTFSSPSCA